MTPRVCKLNPPEAIALLAHYSRITPDARHAQLVKQLIGKVLTVGRTTITHTDFENDSNSRKTLGAQFRNLLYVKLMPQVSERIYRDVEKVIAKHAKDAGVDACFKYLEHFDPWVTDSASYFITSQTMRFTLAPAMAEWAYVESANGKYGAGDAIFETRAYLERSTRMGDNDVIGQLGNGALSVMREEFAKSQVAYWAMNLRRLDYERSELNEPEQFTALVSQKSLQINGGFAKAGMNQELVEAVAGAFGKCMSGIIAPATEKLEGIIRGMSENLLMID